MHNVRITFAPNGSAINTNDKAVKTVKEKSQRSGSHLRVRLFRCSGDHMLRMRSPGHVDERRQPSSGCTGAEDDSPPERRLRSSIASRI